jgi:hypothetical protein
MECRRVLDVERVWASCEQQLLRALDMTEPTHALRLDLVVKFVDYEQARRRKNRIVADTSSSRNGVRKACKGFAVRWHRSSQESFIASCVTDLHQSERVGAISESRLALSHVDGLAEVVKMQALHPTSLGHIDIVPLVVKLRLIRCWAGKNKQRQHYRPFLKRIPIDVLNNHFWC